MKLSLLFISLIIAFPTAGIAGGLRAGTCGACHVGNYNSWQNSAHSRSILSDDFRSALKTHLLVEGKDEGGFCFGCHAPTINIVGNEFQATRKILKGKPLKAGVTCIVCHGVESIKKGKAVYDTANISSYHIVKDLKNIDKESLCSMCHNSAPKLVKAEIPKQGFLKKISIKAGLIIGRKSTVKTDHKFSESFADTGEDKTCPGL